MPAPKRKQSGLTEHPENAGYVADVKLPSDHPRSLLPNAPYYVTKLGATYLGESLGMLRTLPDASTNLVLTSPPYALHFQKEYGNVSKDEYVEWLLPFAKEVRRILTDDGSFVLNIGGSWNKGTPTRSVYHFKLLVALVESVGFHLAQMLLVQPREDACPG